MTTDLVSAIKVVNVLNVDSNDSTITQTQLISNTNYDKHIVSDVDEELLILVEFIGSVDLRMIKIYSTSDSKNTEISAPKDVNIYTPSNVNIDFEDICSFKPSKSIKCNHKLLKKGQKFILNFTKIRYLAIYIKSNQNDTEKTCVTSIRLKGKKHFKSQDDEKVITKTTRKQKSSDDYTANNNDPAPNISNAQCIEEAEHDISKCSALNRFISTLTEYTNSQSITDKVVSAALSDYLHLCKYHDNDIEFISSKLKICDMTKCIMFKRNHRDRQKYGDNDKRKELYYGHDDAMDIAMYQIMDKMHCHYCHCYDIGNGIKLQESNQLNIDENKNDNYLLCDGIDNERKQRTRNMHHIISNNILNKNASNKYMNAINNRNIHRYHLIQDPLQITSEDTKMYKFGFQFLYGLKNENSIISATHNANIASNDEKEPSTVHELAEAISNLKAIQLRSRTAVYQLLEMGSLVNICENNSVYQQYTNQNAIEIKAKYKSLKQELIANNLCIITIEQYDNELKKAQIYFNHPFRKSNMEWQDMRIENVLSLLIYCNFDTLQYHFSKTYRENPQQHAEFFHLGKLIKMSVHQFGQQINSGHKFYHGISEKLYFSAIFNNVYCYGPLSTTSELSIADNFANSAAGLIVEFSVERVHSERRPNYFDVSWLSDYSNEKEKLFIQNYFPLSIKNIIDPLDGTHYDIFFEAIKYVDRYKIETDSFKEIRDLIKALIAHQLSFKMPQKYNRGKITVYGQKTLDIYFKDVKSYEILLDPPDNNDMQCVSDFFLDETQIFELINILFPNIEELYVTQHIRKNPKYEHLNKKPTNLRAEILDNAVTHIQRSDNTLKKINIWIDANSELSKENAIIKYQPVFMKHGYFIQCRTWDSDEILIQHQAIAMKQLLEYSLVGTREIDYRSLEYSNEFSMDHNMSSLLESLLKYRLNEEQKLDDDVSVEVKDEFVTYCNSIQRVDVFWKIFTSKKYQFVSNLLKMQYDRIGVSYEWINLNQFITLFPNLQILWVWDCILTENVVENIFDFIVSTNNKLQEIHVVPQVIIQNTEKQWKPQDSIKQFEVIGAECKYDYNSSYGEVWRGAHARGSQWCFEMEKSRKLIKCDFVSKSLLVKSKCDGKTLKYQEDPEEFPTLSIYLNGSEEATKTIEMGGYRVW